MPRNTDYKTLQRWAQNRATQMTYIHISRGLIQTQMGLVPAPKGSGETFRYRKPEAEKPAPVRTKPLKGVFGCRRDGDRRVA